MVKPKNTQKLNAKQALFCKEYLVDLNATQAAIRAGYSEKTAYSQGQRLLKHVEIKKRIADAKINRSERVEINADYVLERLKQIDELDVLHIIDDDGKLKQIRDWPKEWRTSISGLDVQEMLLGDIETTIKKIKWPDKLRNLELLGKHVNVKAWDKEGAPPINNYIMPVPTADSVEEWEKIAEKQQKESLSHA